jgi:large subunit ribosomal protein L21
MYAVIQAGGKQFRVSEGDIIKLDRLKGNPGDPIEFTKVLMIENNGQLRVKQGDVKGTKVTGKILAKTQGKKIRVFRYRRRKNTMRTKGSRPQHTTVSIEKIVTA